LWIVSPKSVLFAVRSEAAAVLATEGVAAAATEKVVVAAAAKEEEAAAAAKEEEQEGKWIDVVRRAGPGKQQAGTSGGPPELSGRSGLGAKVLTGEEPDCEGERGGAESREKDAEGGEVAGLVGG
jgi:hypothetical protein